MIPQLLIPIISGVLYRLGGSDQPTWLPSWFSMKILRWFMGIPIALILHNGWYVLTYFIATSVFVYGDNSWVTALVGRRGAWIVHGLAFGLASIQPLYALWTAVVFYLLFFIADEGVIDNKYAEFGRGFLGTLLLVFN